MLVYIKLFYISKEAVSQEWEEKKEENEERVVCIHTCGRNPQRLICNKI
jgi:hypothetical protein